jgi:hypothetical protein
MGLRAAEPLLLLGIGSAVAAPVAGTP